MTCLSQVHCVGSIRRDRTALRSLIAVLLLCTTLSVLGTDVLTSQYDDARTGANRDEQLLAPANVTPATFGRLFSYEVDGPVFGQPLSVTDVAGQDGKSRTLVFVTTTANSVYAFDANGDKDAVIWHRTLTRLPDGTEADIRGIWSTPVIDRASGTLYVVAGFKEGEHLRFAAHALDLASGRDRDGSPALVTGEVAVDGTRIAFAPTENRMAMQRAGLALAGGKLVVAFGGDFFEGWIIALDKNDLRKPSSAHCTTCTSRVTSISGVDYLDEKCTFVGPAGGVWQAGRAPAVDPAGHLYFFTGNKAHAILKGCPIPPGVNACSNCASGQTCICEGVGSPKVCRGPDTCAANSSGDGRSFDTHDALVRLDPRRGLGVTGWFRPDNWNIAGPEGLEINDLDLGSAGPVLVPGSTKLIGAGKQGVMYLLEGGSRGGSCTASARDDCLGPRGANPLQSFPIAPTPPAPNQYYRHVFGGPVLWTRPQGEGGSWVYTWREHDHLRAFRLSDRFEDCNAGHPASCDSWARSDDYIAHHPGGMLSLSSHGTDASSGIVWASTVQSPGGPGKLLAFRAMPPAETPGRLQKLWDSDDCTGDMPEAGSGFIPPTVANGRVYLATQAGTVVVYGAIERRECVRPEAPLIPHTLQF